MIKLTKNLIGPENNVSKLSNLNPNTLKQDITDLKLSIYQLALLVDAQDKQYKKITTTEAKVD